MIRRKRLDVEAQTTTKRKKQKRAANSSYSKRHRSKVAAYYRNRRSTDPDYKMACWARGMVHKLLRRENKRKDARTVAILGYDGPALRAHLERQFVKGMAWDNHGAWHIDHIVPVAEFVRRGQLDPAIVNALPNLRPMWAADNIRKSDKLIAIL